MEPVYQAIYADKVDFNEVLISPTMVNDHMPDKVMEALEKVRFSPRPNATTAPLSGVLLRPGVTSQCKTGMSENQATQQGRCCVPLWFLAPKISVLSN